MAAGADIFSGLPATAPTLCARQAPATAGGGGSPSSQKILRHLSAKIDVLSTGIFRHAMLSSPFFMTLRTAVLCRRLLAVMALAGEKRIIGRHAAFMDAALPHPLRIALPEAVITKFT